MNSAGKIIVSGMRKPYRCRLSLRVRYGSHVEKNKANRCRENNVKIIELGTHVNNWGATRISTPRSDFHNLGLTFRTPSTHNQTFPSSFHCERRSARTMSADILSKFPLELLTSIIRFLDPLSALHCRQLHSRYKSCVDALPEYRVYRNKFQGIIELYRNLHGKKPPRWTIENAAGLFDTVRVGDEVDDYLYVGLFLSYPQARSYVSVMRN